MEEEVSKKRRELILFIFSAVIFGFVLSILSWALPYFIPSWLSPLNTLIISLFVLILLGYFSFRLIIPPLQIKDIVDFCLIQDMKQKSIFNSTGIYYTFLSHADHAFQELKKKNPEYNEILGKPLKFEDKILHDLMIYLIIYWLVILPAFVRIFAFRRSPRPPRLYFDIEEKMKNVHIKYYAKNLKDNIFLNISSIREMIKTIRLPRNMKISIEENKIVLQNRYIKITITFAFYEWFRGIDLRLQHFLNLTDEETKTLGTLVGGIHFEAKFKPWAILIPSADKYYYFAKEMLKNLHDNYSWSACLEDLKESLLWKHLLRNQRQK